MSGGAMLRAPEIMPAKDALDRMRNVILDYLVLEHIHQGQNAAGDGGEAGKTNQNETLGVSMRRASDPGRQKSPYLRLFPAIPAYSRVMKNKIFRAEVELRREINSDSYQLTVINSGKWNFVRDGFNDARLKAACFEDGMPAGCSRDWEFFSDLSQSLLTSTATKIMNHVTQN